MELQTAQRIGYSTSLRWLMVDGLRVVGVIDQNGKESRDIKTSSDLCGHYTSADGTHPPVSLFSQFLWKTTATDTKNNIKPQPGTQQKKPTSEKKQKKNSKKNTDIKESTTAMDDRRDKEQEANEPSRGQVTFEKDVEIVHELLGHYNGELKYVMEFENWDDLVYRHGKLKEKMPQYSYSFRTKRAIVTYGQLG